MADRPITAQFQLETMALDAYRKKKHYRNDALRIPSMSRAAPKTDRSSTAQLLLETNGFGCQLEKTNVIDTTFYEFYQSQGPPRWPMNLVLGNFS